MQIGRQPKWTLKHQTYRVDFQTRAPSKASDSTLGCFPRRKVPRRRGPSDQFHIGRRSPHCIQSERAHRSRPGPGRTPASQAARIDLHCEATMGKGRTDEWKDRAQRKRESGRETEREAEKLLSMRKEECWLPWPHGPPKAPLLFAPFGSLWKVATGICRPHAMPAKRTRPAASGARRSIAADPRLQHCKAAAGTTPPDI